MAPRATPALVPVLSVGKHRNPKRGACFMEYASYLAGEKWSDHPACTHPLLAGVARVVNDNTTDEGRPKLVPLIPSVIGLTGDDLAIDVGIAVRCAAIAIPVVAAERQHALACGLLSAERVFAKLADERPTTVDVGDLLDHSRHALERVPHAAKWARSFNPGWDIDVRGFQRRGAPTMVRVSVVGIAKGCVPDPDALLYELLSSVIDDCSKWLAGATPEGESTRAAGTRLLRR